MKSILLIGGAGYVGTVMTSEFLKKGHKVTVLDEFVYDNQFSVYPFVGDENYKLFKGDFCDNTTLAKASEGVSDVIILGGLVGDPITKKYPNESDQINSKGVQNCIDFFSDKDISKLLFISTCSNYGLIGENELANEEFDLNPLSLYAEAKVDAEKYLISKKGTTKFTGTVLRFATAFGLSPRMRFDLTVSEFTRDLFFGETLSVFDEHTWRPYCHVRDFARLADMVIHADDDKVNFEVFNAGGNMNNFTKKMIIDEIVKFVPEAKVEYVQHGSDPRNYRVSFDKVRDTLGFEPKFSVQDGIRELVEALGNGLYADSSKNKSAYGNFELNYQC